MRKGSILSRALARAGVSEADKRRDDIEREAECRVLKALFMGKKCALSELFIGETRAARTRKQTVYNTSKALH